MRPQLAAPVTSLIAPLTLAALACAGPACADSFALNDNSALEVGRANAGAATQTGDASAAYGNADFIVPAQAAFLTTGGALTDTTGRAAIDLPATVEAGVSWQAADNLALYLNLRWRFWSSVEELRVQFDNPAQPDAVEPLNYKDSGRIVLGADYAISDAWSVRAGFAYDQTPTQAEFRSARISDDNRYYFALGASFTGWEGWQVDLAYNRVEIEDHDFDHTGNFGDLQVGEYSGAADVVSVGVTWRGARR